MKLVAMIGPTDVQEVEAEGDDYQAARDAIDTKVPDGWRVLSYRTVHD